MDVSSGAVVASLETEGGVTSWLSDDGRTLVTQNAQGIHVWDLPLRPPLRLVIGIPLGLGLLVLLFSRWRAWRRGRATEAAVGPVTMNPEQKT